MKTNMKYYFLLIICGILTGLFSIFRFTVETLSEKHLTLGESITTNSMLEASMALAALGGALSFTIVKLFPPYLKLVAYQ